MVKTSEARAAATAEAKAFLFGERLASLVSLKVPLRVLEKEVLCEFQKYSFSVKSSLKGYYKILQGSAIWVLGFGVYRGSGCKCKACM